MVQDLPEQPLAAFRWIIELTHNRQMVTKRMAKKTPSIAYLTTHTLLSKGTSYKEVVHLVDDLSTSRVLERRRQSTL